MNDIVSAKNTEKHFVCDELGSHFVINDNIYLCCPKSPKDPEFFTFPYDTVSQGLEKWKQRTNELLAMHRSGIVGPCQGCGHLREGSSPREHKEVAVRISPGFKGDLCNLKCSYCKTPSELANKEYNKDLKEIVTKLVEIYKDSTLSIRFTNGEFLARKDANDILEYLAPQNVQVFLTTNATIYSASFEKLITLGKAKMIAVSPDAGTRETYKKIKGNDLFDKVVNNLEKYSEKGVFVDLKYIILPGVNDNNVDFVGFINLAILIKKVKVWISADLTRRRLRLPEYTLAQAVELHNMAKKCGLPVGFNFECFNAEDAKAIKLIIERKEGAYQSVGDTKPAVVENPKTVDERLSVLENTIKALPSGADVTKSVSAVNQLMQYHSSRAMNRIAGRMDFYLIAGMISNYYSSHERYSELDEAGKNLVDYLSSDEFYRDNLSYRHYPPDTDMQQFIKNYYPDRHLYLGYQCLNNRADYPVYFQDGKCYGLLENRKCFLMDNQESAQRYWWGIMGEQVPGHPHCYLEKNGDFIICQNDIIADIGASEGFFSLPHLDKIKHAYIFEASDTWFNRLQDTYAPFKDKVTLVKGFVGDGKGNISLDEYFKDKEKPTFFKMDVEGDEGSVLRSMNGMLTNSDLPMRLAVCTYHRQEDAPYIESLLGEDFEIHYSGYFWHVPDPMPPFLRHGVMRATKKSKTTKVSLTNDSSSIVSNAITSKQASATTIPTVSSSPNIPSIKSLGCKVQLGREIVIGEKTSLCCPSGAKNPEQFIIDFTDVEQGMREAEKRIKEIDELHLQGIAGPCEGCSYLVDAAEAKKRNDTIGILTASRFGFKDDVCNVRCCYCNFEAQGKSDPPVNTDLMQTIEKIVEAYKGKMLNINLSNAEFLARRDADKILNYLLPHNVVVHLTTNGSIWSEAFDELIKAKKAGSINVSLDSGTRETYKKVKNRDFFDRVVGNLERYSQKGLPIDIKYIILPGINDNEVDFQGFIDIAKRINTRFFRIAANGNSKNVPMSDYARNQTVHFYELAVAQGFHPEIQYGYFNNNDAKLIKNQLQIKAPATTSAESSPCSLKAERTVYATPPQNSDSRGLLLDAKTFQNLTHISSTISFSHRGQDKIVEAIFQMVGVKKPSYLDIGCNDPIVASNTALFYRDGCSGVVVDANENHRKNWAELRPRDVFVNTAISPVGGEDISYYMYDDYSGRNSADLNEVNRFIAEEKAAGVERSIKKTLTLKTLTVNQIVDMYCSGKFPDYLSIDIEGFDLPVLTSIDFTKSAPKVISLEDRSPQTIRFLRENGFYPLICVGDIIAVHNDYAHKVAPVLFEK